jgi:phosphoribosylglycinamide formyltransferase-1
VEQPETRQPARKRLVVLISGSGTLLQALIDASADPAFGADVVGVGSDRSGIAGLDRAREAGIDAFVHPYRKGEDRAAWDRELTALVGAHRPDLVISAGFMKLVGPTFLTEFAGRMINTHPALLPSFPGMHGPRDALAYGVKVTGATLFLVDHGVDDGVIIDQAAVPVHDDDDVETLHERIKITERKLLVETTHRLVTRPWRVIDRKVCWDDDTRTP